VVNYGFSAKLFKLNGKAATNHLKEHSKWAIDRIALSLLFIPSARVNRL